MDGDAADMMSVDMCRNGMFPSGADAAMLSGVPVICIAKALLRSRNIVATLLAYNVEYYFTTIPVAFRLACLYNESMLCICCNCSPTKKAFISIYINVESIDESLKRAAASPILRKKI